jgi:hypothetical protein
MFLGSLILYWVLFWFKVLKNPYIMAYGCALDTDFPTWRLCGEYWKKGKIPKDPYYFQDLTGERAGTFYPINIITSMFGQGNLDRAWKIYLGNLLSHHLFIIISAYYLFGQGYLGLFGAVMWGFAGYHIKNTLWYMQAFTWITLTTLFIETNNFIGAGLGIGMLILSGHAPLVIYYLYLAPIWAVLTGKWWFFASLAAGITIGLPQILAYYRYRKLSGRSDCTYEDNIKEGKYKLWGYLFMFLPIRIRDFLFGIGYEEWHFYISPLALLFLFGRGHCWLLVIFAALLSTGGRLFRLFNKFLFRFPHRWGYFVMLGTVVLAVDGLRNITTNYFPYVLLLMFFMLFNRDLIDIYPFSQNPFGKPPSFFYNTPILNWLKDNSKWYKVNNLPFPAYSGQLLHIKTVGYTGGNHLKSLGEFLKVPKHGYAPYNWFDFKPDGKELDDYGIKYHCGKQPAGWIKIMENLWMNPRM